MFTRVLSSAAAGIAVTTGLLFLMQYLIASSEEIIIDAPEGSTLDWIALKAEERLIVDPPIFDRPEPPLIPPSNKSPEPLARPTSGKVAQPSEMSLQPEGRAGHGKGGENVYRNYESRCQKDGAARSVEPTEQALPQQDSHCATGGKAQI